SRMRLSTRIVEPNLAQPRGTRVSAVSADARVVPPRCPSFRASLGNGYPGGGGKLPGQPVPPPPSDLAAEGSARRCGFAGDCRRLPMRGRFTGTERVSESDVLVVSAPA